ncbi:50S ribosomal protein L29 [Candidatus Pacearchaeota archaeon]|nr:50S ribosomal protein L29 [Candidatus Pacearchaeota archaeon]
MVKTNELKNLSKQEKEKKLAELKLELLKSRVKNSKTSSKTKEIKKIIARILTLNKTSGEIS